MNTSADRRGSLLLAAESTLAYVDLALERLRRRDGPRLSPRLSSCAPIG
jgi:hypothetical protein